MMWILIVCKAALKHSVGQVEAAMSVRPLPRAQKGETAREEVTNLKLSIAAIRRNAENTLDKRVRITRLHKSLRYNRVQTAPEIRAQVEFALVPANGGVGEGVRV